MLRKLYGIFLARRIERAMNDPVYCGHRVPFLCTVIRRHNEWLWYLPIKHIVDTLGMHATLRGHLEAATSGRLPHRWEDREVYHRRFWILMCKALRKGDFKWGRVIDLEEMGMTHLMQEANCAEDR